MSLPDFEFDDVEIEKLMKERTDWKNSAEAAWREITNLKRRITSMRNSLKSVQRDTTIPVVADTARWAIERDDAVRRRFERAEKRRDRR